MLSTREYNVPPAVYQIISLHLNKLAWRCQRTEQTQLISSGRIAVNGLMQRNAGRDRIKWRRQRNKAQSVNGSAYERQ